MHDIIKSIRKIAQNAPLSGYITNSDYCVTELKMTYNLDDISLCKILGQMKYDGLIRDFGFQYSMHSDVIYKYWFK